MEIKNIFICFCLCFIFIEFSSAGTSATNNTEFNNRVQKKPQKFIISARQFEKGREFVGRTWNLLVNKLDSISGSKNITALTSSLGLPSISSFSTTGISNNLGNEVAKIPLYIGLPILIVGIAILIKAIAFIVAYIPGYTAPIYNKLAEQYGEFFQFDNDDSSGNDGHGWQSPSSSYGAPQGDSYSNSRVTYVQTPAPQVYYAPGPNREQLNAATQQLNQAVNKYSQI